ncbi:DNA primase small subunit [Trypanosoma conorhini]|uniref:DNA primase small subunit n=1 Tax=Trypanosoma conorhini TaxID=83891 RepID=A0A3R7L9N7_9TRYP|nr:DNA primase small subunit [Trypanosoma conorhini]RNF22692.1 DNA primase small subunit [Trypanosoma conorhini]
MRREFGLHSAALCGDNSPGSCNTRPHVMAAPPREVMDHAHAMPSASPPDPVWAPLAIDEKDLAAAARHAPRSPVNRSSGGGSSLGEAGREGVIRLSRGWAEPGARPRGSSTGSSCERKNGRLVDGGAGPQEEAGEWAGPSAATTASGYNTSDGAARLTAQSSSAERLLEPRPPLELDAAAHGRQETHAGSSGVVPTASSRTSSRGSSGVAVRRRAAKAAVKDVTSLLEAVNGVSSSRQAKRKVAGKPDAVRRLLSPAKSQAPRDTFAALEEQAPAAAPDATDRSRGTRLAAAGRAGQAEATDKGASNGAAPSRNASGDKQAQGKGEGAPVSGVAAEATTSDSGAQAPPVTPQRQAFPGGVKAAAPPLPSAAAQDPSQGGGSNSARPIEAAMAPQQQQQHGSVLAHNTQKMMSPVMGASPWTYLSAPDFVSCLQLYVKTCLGLREPDLQARQRFIARVQRIVTKVLGPRAEVRVHGSITTDLALASSDIDLLVVGYEPLTPLQAIQQLSRAILHISEEELQELESGEAGAVAVAAAAAAAEGFSQACHDTSAAGAAEEALGAKDLPASSPVELEEVTLESGGELEAGDPIMRVEEEEAEYRSQIERDYVFSTRAGLSSAARATALPTQGPTTAAMALQGYMGPLSAAPLQHYGGAGGHRLYVPTLGGPYFHVQTIISTRVPVIKVAEKSTGMKGDITFAGGEHWRSMQLTNHLLKRFPASRGLILFLKHCVRQMGIGDSQPGGVTSFVIYLLVLHFFNEVSCHLEGFLQQQQQQQKHAGRTSVATQWGNGGMLASSSGMGDAGTGGVGPSATRAATPRAQTPLPTQPAPAAPLPPSRHTSYLDKLFLVERAFVERFRPYHKEQEGKRNTAGILHYILTFLQEEQPAGCEGGETDRAAGRLKERTGAKLVAPVCYDAASDAPAPRGEVLLATSEAPEAPDVASEPGGNDDKVDAYAGNSEGGSDDDDDGDDGGQNVAAELNPAAEGDTSDDDDDGGGGGGLQEREKEEGEVTEDGKTSLVRSLALRLLSTSSLGHLFHDFCFYYGFTFDYDSHGLYFDPLGNSSVVPKPQKCQKRGQHLFMTSPFDDQYDLTARMLHTREFQELCRMFVPLTTPLATLAGYGGGGCSLQEVLEWISPETAFEELMQVHAAIQQQQQQQQQQRAEASGGAHALKSEEQLLPLPTHADGGKAGTPHAQPSLEAREHSTSSPRPLPADGAEEQPPQDTRFPQRQDPAAFKASGSAVSTDSRRREERAATEATTDVPAAAAPLTPAHGGPSLQQVGVKALLAEPGNTESTGSRSATQRQLKRREGGTEDAAAAEVAMRPASPSGAAGGSGPLPASGLPAGGNVNSVGGEAVYARAQHLRPGPMHHQQQQLPFPFPPPIHMFLMHPNGGGAGYPDMSPFYFQMQYSPEAMLHYPQQQHHHHHHQYQTPPHMQPFPYIGYDMNQFYQQRGVFDVLNGAGAAAVSSSSSSGGGGGGGAPAASRQVSTRGGGASPSSVRQRGRGGAHRGTAAGPAAEKTPPPVKPAASSLVEGPAASTEGAAADGRHSSKPAAFKDPMAEGPSTRERPKAEAAASASLAHEVQQHPQYFQLHHHHHHHQQQQQQLGLSHQYHLHQQQQQQMLWRQQQQQSSLMMPPPQMCALPGNVDGLVSSALCAPVQGGAVFRQQPNASGTSYPAAATAPGFPRAPAREAPAYNSPAPVANENSKQQPQRGQYASAPQRLEGSAAAAAASSRGSSASSSARGGGPVRLLRRAQEEDVGEGRVTE